jgi:hypothetical protein
MECPSREIGEFGNGGNLAYYRSRTEAAWVSLPDAPSPDLQRHGPETAFRPPMRDMWPCSRTNAALIANDAVERAPARRRTNSLGLLDDPCFTALLHCLTGLGRFGHRLAGFGAMI